MIRKCLISGIIIISFTVMPVFPQDELTVKTANEILSFEQRFKAVDESMNYLKSKNIDSNDIISVYTDAESLFRELKYTSELKDYDMAVRFLSHKLSVLEEKSSDRVSLARRMDLMYILMVSMGIIIIVVMSLYSIYMYSRRK